jgi:hypothetical protein
LMDGTNRSMICLFGLHQPYAACHQSISAVTHESLDSPSGPSLYPSRCHHY